MKTLIKIMFVLGFVFVSTFFIFRYSGLITLEKIEEWLILAQLISPYYVIFIVIVLLCTDLFISIPTMVVMVSSGYFLGATIGAFSSIVGLILCGCIGYGLSFKYGSRLLRFFINDESKIVDAEEAFLKHGFVIILLSRAVPTLPEVAACMAGATNMPFLKFIGPWMLSIIPSALIASYAGSVSSPENLKPAIFAVLGLTGCLWFGWLICKKWYFNKELVS